MLPQAIIPIIGVIVVVLIAFMGFRSQGYFIHLALISTPIAIYLLSNPSAWLVAVLGVSQSKLIFPGLPQGLQVVHALMFGFVAVVIARNIILKPASPGRRMSNLFLLGFLAVIIATAVVRGSGLRFLGSSLWGGMGYIKVVLAGAFVLTSRYIPLTDKQLRLTILLMLSLSLLPVASQFLYVLSRGSIYQQYYFVEAYVGGLMESLNAIETGRGAVRFHMLATLSSNLLLCGLALIPWKSFYKVLIGLLLFIVLLMAGLSGFRGSFLLAVGTLFILVVITAEDKKYVRLVSLMAIVFMSLAIVYPFTNLLPGSIQRTLSWLPGADIPIEIKIEAMNSVVHRTRVWQMAWNEVPQYLWIGKGFTINPADILAITVRQDWALNAFLSHNYHSGPLSMLLDTGLFGFIFGTGFMLTSCYEAYRQMSRLPDDAFLKRFYMVFLAQYIYSVPAFFLIFGDVKESFVSMFINFSILNVLARTSEAKVIKKEALEKKQAERANAKRLSGMRNRRLISA
jgi:hypothetical protein